MKERTKKNYIINRIAELQVKSFIKEMIEQGKTRSEIKDLFKEWKEILEGYENENM